MSYIKNILYIRAFPKVITMKFLNNARSRHSHCHLRWQRHAALQCLGLTPISTSSAGFPLMHILEKVSDGPALGPSLHREDVCWVPYSWLQSCSASSDCCKYLESELIDTRALSLSLSHSCKQKWIIIFKIILDYLMDAKLFLCESKKFWDSSAQ